MTVNQLPVRMWLGNGYLIREMLVREDSVNVNIHVQNGKTQQQQRGQTNEVRCEVWSLFEDRTARWLLIHTKRIRDMAK